MPPIVAIDCGRQLRKSQCRFPCLQVDLKSRVDDVSATIDEILDLISFAGAELVNGNANHGPMAAEALFALGRDEAVLPWVESYRSRLTHRPVAMARIAREDWREHLGKRDRLGDWIHFFQNELAEHPWQSVVREWVPRLAPGLMAAAGHGLIRTAHAARSLSSAETRQRIEELAQGLGYWAARYYVLPGTPSGENAGHTPSGGLAHVRRLHGPEFDASGSIIRQIQGLESHPEFESTVDLVDTGEDVSRFISSLTETFTGIYLANQKDLIAFVHAVTAPSALRLLAPYLSKLDGRRAARYAWQGCSAIYSWYSTAPPPDTAQFEAPEEGAQELTDRAVAAGGAHSIKLTEACLREYALNPNPVYLVAARDVSERVGPV